MFGSHEPDYVKGALAGMAGGLVASFVMNQLQAALAKVKSNGDPHEEDQRQPDSDQELVRDIRRHLDGFAAQPGFRSTAQAAQFHH